MDITDIPQVIVEMSPYIRAIDGLLSAEEQAKFKYYIGLNPMSGVLIPNTGGLRKIRWYGGGHGKKGGIRVIYYYYSENHPVFLLTAYAKNKQNDLTGFDKRTLRNVVDSIKLSIRLRGIDYGG